LLTVASIWTAPAVCDARAAAGYFGCTRLITNPWDTPWEILTVAKVGLDGLDELEDIRLLKLVAPNVAVVDDSGSAGAESSDWVLPASFDFTWIGVEAGFFVPETVPETDPDAIPEAELAVGVFVGVSTPMWIVGGFAPPTAPFSGELDIAILGVAVAGAVDRAAEFGLADATEGLVDGEDGVAGAEDGCPKLCDALTGCGAGVVWSPLILVYPK
jgi:hypothetical protein